MNPREKPEIDLGKIIKRATRAVKAGLSDDVEITDRDLAIEFIQTVKANTAAIKAGTAVAKRLISCCEKLARSLDENTETMLDDEDA